MMRLRQALTSDLEALAGWFASEAEVKSWGGPYVHFPLIPGPQLLTELQWDSWTSYSLVDSENELVGFSMVTDRYGRKHIGRVVVDPSRRGRGFGRKLMELVLASAVDPGADVSLKVEKDNSTARDLYESLGFRVQPFPDERESRPGTLFMVRKGNW